MAIDNFELSLGGLYMAAMRIGCDEILQARAAHGRGALRYGGAVARLLRGKSAGLRGRALRAACKPIKRSCSDDDKGYSQDNSAHSCTAPRRIFLWRYIIL